MDEKLGAKFWVRLIGTAVVICIGGMLALIFISRLIIGLGILGGLIALGIIFMAFGWWYDRREAKRDREYGTGAT